MDHEVQWGWTLQTVILFSDLKRLGFKRLPQGSPIQWDGCDPPPGVATECTSFRRPNFKYSVRIERTTWDDRKTFIAMTSLPDEKKLLIRFDADLGPSNYEGLLGVKNIKFRDDVDAIRWFVERVKENL